MRLLADPLSAAMMIRWPVALDAMEREITGPLDEDEFDGEMNGDPDSLTGEEDEAGYDEMPAAYWLDEQLGDDGFDDAEGEGDEAEDGDDGEGEADC